ncbi:hypothetical protein NKR23_g3175 [Pleurostoma richardsiae]|uniref:Uncharacterized protein n=1 Tax=Pleurostoma richardsiae TaxID=41990 RepID=A0AA38RZZ7_9PEZI|nr:hypothetical protein NKR23_g3175 [Pleurostoma richardsiae]
MAAILDTATTPRDYAAKKDGFVPMRSKAITIIAPTPIPSANPPSSAAGRPRGRPRGRTSTIVPRAGHISKPADPSRSSYLLSTFDKGGRSYIRLQPAGQPRRRITKFVNEQNDVGAYAVVTRVSPLPLKVGADAPDYGEEEDDRAGDGINKPLTVIKRGGRTFIKLSAGAAKQKTAASELIRLP